jgi:ABC-type uncharacterized transport system permease subunit
MNNIILPASGLALVLYAVAFALLWRHLNTRLHQAGDNISGAPPSVSGIAFVAAALGLICQFLVTVSALIQNEPVMSLNLSLLAVSSLVTCVIVGVTAISTLRVRADNLMLLCLPLAAISLGALSLIPAGNTQPIALDSAQIGHILLSISAYAALMTAALQSVLIALQERRLRTPQTGLIGLLPPMESMENLFITMLWLGVGLLTLSIGTGIFFLQDMFDQRLVHHTVLTSMSWMVYVGFLTGHHLFGWRGVTGVRWNLAAFALLLLGYLGSKFVLEYLL